MSHLEQEEKGASMSVRKTSAKTTDSPTMSNQPWRTALMSKLPIIDVAFGGI